MLNRVLMLKVVFLTMFCIICYNVYPQKIDSATIADIQSMAKKAENWDSLKLLVKAKYLNGAAELREAKNFLYHKHVLPLLLHNNLSFLVINDSIFKRFGNDADVYSRVSYVLFEKRIKPYIESETDWRVILNKIKSEGLQQLDLYLLQCAIDYYGAKIDVEKQGLKNFVEIINHFLKRYPAKVSADQLNNWAWFYIFQNSSDQLQLKSGLHWAKLAINLSPENAGFIDTYANLLYKTGKRDEALRWAEKAVQLETKQGVDTGVKSNYEKMKTGIQTW